MDYADARSAPGSSPRAPTRPASPSRRSSASWASTSVIKLASNENPEGPLPAVLEAIGRAALRDQPLSRRRLLRADAAPVRAPGRRPAAVLIFGNGSNEVIDMLIRALVSPGRERRLQRAQLHRLSADLAACTSSAAAPCPLGCGRPPRPAGDGGARSTTRTKLVIVCNPNNPTGTYNTAAEFARLPGRGVPERRGRGRRGLLRVRRRRPTTRRPCRCCASIRILSSCGPSVKSTRLAGLRVGYGVGHPDLIGRAAEDARAVQREPLSQAAAVACLDELARGRRPRAGATARSWSGWRPNWRPSASRDAPSQTNFLLSAAPATPPRLADDLLRQGVIVRPMDSFGLGRGALRISVGLPAENRRCIAALKEMSPDGHGRPQLAAPRRTSLPAFRRLPGSRPPRSRSAARGLRRPEGRAHRRPLRRGEPRAAPGRRPPGPQAAGAAMLRGGAWKPRTSPYDFQGLGPEGLALLAEARAATGCRSSPRFWTRAT